jgi:hypothetical protein
MAAAATPPRTENPYAGSTRKTLGHRVFEPQARRLTEIAGELQAESYKASAADLLQAILHFHTPADVDAAAELVDQWAALSDIGGPDDPYSGAGQVNLGHRVFEPMYDRLTELELELREAGYPARPYNRSQLTRAILHFRTPTSNEEAVELLREWARVKRAPPARARA